MADEILVKQDGPILRITLNAPDRGNAVTDDMVRELTKLINEAREEIRHRGAARRRQGLLRRPRRHGRAARGRADRLRAAEFLRRGVRRLWRDAQLPDPDHRRGAGRRARLRLRHRRGLRHHASRATRRASRCRRWRTRSCRPWCCRRSSTACRGRRRPIMLYSMFEVSAERALSYGIVSDVVPAAQLDAHVDKLTTAMLKAPRISLTQRQGIHPHRPRHAGGRRGGIRPQPARHHQLRRRNQEAARARAIAGMTENRFRNRMKVFIFDLLAYGKHFDQYKRDKYLPYPLPAIITIARSRRGPMSSICRPGRRWTSSASTASA